MRAFLIAAWGLAAISGACQAQDGRGSAESPEALIKDYCLGIADPAADARIARQEFVLNTLRREVEDKIGALEQRTAELKLWVERQDRMLKAANASLAGIYAKMDPGTAAQQLGKVSTATAVSVVSQLNARAASAILNEMPPETAAALVKALASPLAGARPGDGS